MSPEQASFIVPIGTCLIIFLPMYFNIWIARKRVRVWKKNSSIIFLRSLGVGGIKKRSSAVWMKECGYDEAEALILAKFQSRAIFEICIGILVLFAVASSIQTR